jgi:hypothetical protein
MGRVTLDYLQNLTGTVSVPVADLRIRVVQTSLDTYDGGEWNPTTSYNFVPGASENFTPERADSRIRFRMRLPVAWVSANHAIGHFRFRANNVTIWEWSESGTNIENAKTFEFDIPSWGTTRARIGLQHRSYTNDSNELRMYSTYYWNGVSSRQNAFGLRIIEEYVY